jgi:hypothetical protein
MQVFQPNLPGIIVRSVVNQDHLKVLQQVLMKDAVQALPEILFVVVIDKDAD